MEKRMNPYIKTIGSTNKLDLRWFFLTSLRSNSYQFFLCIFRYFSATLASAIFNGQSYSRLIVYQLLGKKIGKLCKFSGQYEISKTEKCIHCRLKISLPDNPSLLIKVVMLEISSIESTGVQTEIFIKAS